MATQHEGCSAGEGVDARKTLVALLVAFLASIAVAGQAWGSLTGPDSVRPGKNITVFHNSDFVAVFGYPVGKRLTVDVYRGPHRIATAFGPAVAAEGSYGLEVNHGPEGPAVQGDCWEGHTPDILPGDRIMVADSTGGTDQVLVDDIAITRGPTDDASTASPYDVVLEGYASFADGTPIPVDQLSGEMRNDEARFRATPNTIERISGTTDGWRATYKYPYNVTKSEGLPTLEEKKQAIIHGDHEMGYGHVEPLPPETQIAELGATGGPALECGNPDSPYYAPQQANAITTSDDRSVNLASGGLKLGGTAMEEVTAVSVTLSDADPNTSDVTVDATGLTAGPGEKAFSAEFTREQLEGFADGMLTASGAYTLPDGSSISGGTKKLIRKDLVAPRITSNLPTKPIYDGTQLVTLSSDGEEAIRYTTDGSLPSSTSKLYNGAPISVRRSQTIRAFAVDGAGNRTDASFAYTIRQSTSLTLSANPSSVDLGDATRLSGKLRSLGRPLSGKQVVLLHRPAGAGKFTPVPNGTLKARADGTFRLVLKPRRTTVYLAKFPGEARAFKSSVSAPRQVWVIR